MRSVITLLLLFCAANAYCQNAQVVGTALLTGLHQLKMFDYGTGYALSEYDLMKTEDSGKSWVKLLHKDTVMLGMFFIDEQYGWITGGEITGGYVLRTADGGKTWKKQRTQVRQTYKCWFSDARNGWMVGNDGTRGVHYVYHTRDGGIHWKKQQDSVLDYVRDILFTDKRHGWIAGDNGLVYYTLNGGRKWRVYERGFPWHFAYIQAVNDNLLYAVSTSYGCYLTSHNHGRTWKQGKIEGFSSLKAIHFITDSMGYVAGNKGVLLYTTNACVSWKQIPVQTDEDMVAFSFTVAGRGYVAGSKGTVWLIIQ